MDHVFYHSKCYDGFGAAFAHFNNSPVKAEYHPVAYGFPPPKVAGERLFILDFCYPPAETDWLAENFNDVVILDHHKTAIEKLDDYHNPKVTKIFDTAKSGALLSWEYFSTRPVPDLIKHISDRDLWLFKLEGTKFVHRALLSYPMNFKVWNDFDVEKLKVEGVALDRLYNQLVNNICEGSWLGKLAGGQVPMVNTSIAWSEVGQAMLEKYPDHKFVASFTVFNDQVMWSLRCRDGFDVSEIAKKFGGGGHQKAAGFKTPKT